MWYSGGEDDGKKLEQFDEPQEEQHDANIQLRKPKKSTSSLTLLLRNSTEEKHPKQPVPLFLIEKLESCFEAIRNNNPKELKKALSSIEPDDGEEYKKSLLGAQKILRKSIQRNPFNSPDKVKSQKNLSSIEPNAVYEGYKESLFTAQAILYKSIEKEPSSSPDKIASQKILSMLLEADESKEVELIK